MSKTKRKTESAVDVGSTRLLGCPWCYSEKIMAEGTGRVIAMVCQHCGARGPEDRNAHGHASYARILWNSNHWQEDNARLRSNSIRDARRADVANDDLATAMLELRLEKERNAKLVKLVGKKTILKLWRASQPNDPSSPTAGGGSGGAQPKEIK